MFLNIGLTSKEMKSGILDVVGKRGSRENFVASSALREGGRELKARGETVPVGVVCKRPFELPPEGNGPRAPSSFPSRGSLTTWFARFVTARARFSPGR
jgi:hypothetical protein